MTYRDVFTADDEGRSLVRPVVKNPTITTASGIAVDLTFFGRYPAANYLTDGAPNTATLLRRSVDGGMDHGPSLGEGYTKFLAGFTLLSVTAAAAPMTGMVMDYMLYYPLIPMEDTQVMDNTVTLSRFADEGGQIMLVEQFAYTGGGTLQVTYTNQDGVAGRQSAIVTVNTQTAFGTIATSESATAGCPGIFVPLQQGDRSARKIESITFFTPDTGILAAVIVRPLGPFGTYETTNPSEWDMLHDLGRLPIIEDSNNQDAFLSAVITPTGSLSGAIIDAQLKTIWIQD